MTNETVSKLGSLLDSILVMEKDVAEKTRLGEIQAKREERKTRDEFLTDVAPTLMALRGKYIEFSRLPEADPRRQTMPTILETGAEVFAEAKTKWDLNEYGLITFCFNNVFLTENVMKVLNPYSAHKVAEKAVELGHMLPVTEERYRQTLDRVRAISAERKRRKNGEEYDGRLANEPRLQVFKVSSKEGTGYYVERSTFGAKVILALRERLGGSADKARVFGEAVGVLKLEQTVELDLMLLTGAVGKSIAIGFHKPKAQKGESAESIVGQQYALLVSYDGDERLTVEKVVTFGADGAENVFTGLDGKSFKFLPDETLPEMRELPFEFMRFLLFRLTQAGWKYPERSEKDRTLPTHTWTGGPVLNEHEGSHVVPKAPRKGANNPTVRDLTGRGAKPQRRTRRDGGEKEKGGGNARRYQD